MADPENRQPDSVYCDRATVLCVGSDAKAREHLSAALGEYDCAFALSAADALRQQDEGAYDAYILECWMPDWSGALLCREIRKHDPHALIILYTEGTDDLHHRTALQGGASALLCKPVDPECLHDRLRQLLTFTMSENSRAVSQAERVLGDELRRHGVTRSSSTNQTARAVAALGAEAQEIERSARWRTSKTFIDSGGTRARFDRWWGDTRNALFSVDEVSR